MPKLCFLLINSPTSKAKQKIISDGRDNQHGNTIIRESSGLPQRELLRDVVRSSQVSA